MGNSDLIRKRLAGTPGERGRREELLQALLNAFARGGAEAVESELDGRLDALEQAFDGKLEALHALL